MDSINQIAGIVGVSPYLILTAVVWTLIWKGLALWRSAALQQKWWFLVMLLVNTLGILEIIYLFFVARKYTVEVIEKNG